MKLDKVELKKKIIEQIQGIPEGQRVDIDKELLEALLFEEVVIDSEKNIKVKLPIWSGDFLRKINLSQIDFSNVSWSLLGWNEIGTDDLLRIYDNGKSNISDYNAIDEKIYEIMASQPEMSAIVSEINSKGNTSQYIVTYAGTNANIDLSNSFEAMYGNRIVIRDCNFSGINFSNQDLSNFSGLVILHSDISETNLAVPSNTIASLSSLKGVDLTSLTIDATGYFEREWEDFGYCDLTNTGISINLDPNKFEFGKFRDQLHQTMQSFWQGCYVNGKKVLPNDDEEIVVSSNR